jgi:DNA-binding response OmpR family regulator
LSLREFELLRFFVRSPNRVFDRLQILDLVWGHDTYVEPRTVDVHVRRLRARIERDDARPELLVTVRGVGYKFNDRALDT